MLPHLVGFYAVTGMLTGVHYFNRIPFVDFNTRLNASIYMGLGWPMYWPMRLAMNAYAASRRASPQKDAS